MNIVKKMVDAANDASPHRECWCSGKMMLAALTATGLTEAQLEGLANGTVTMVPNAEMERLLSELTMAREGSRVACEANRNLRAMLAAKEAE